MYDNLKDKTVLYVEDELDVLRNISTLLRNFFAKIYIAADGESGLQTFQEKHIDILLIDIELPKMNGIELIKKIRKENKDIPIIIISAYTKTDYLLESIELNLDKYIVKPLTSKKIHLLLEKLNDDFSDNDTVELVEGILLHKSLSIVSFDGVEKDLTRKELAFLKVLAKKKVIHYERVYSLWEGDTPTQNAVRSFIKQLRKKLPDGLIKNKNGIGYSVEGIE